MILGCGPSTAASPAGPTSASPEARTTPPAAETPGAGWCGDGTVDEGEACDDGGRPCPEGWALCRRCIGCERRLLMATPTTLGPHLPQACVQRDGPMTLTRAYDERGRVTSVVSERRGEVTMRTRTTYGTPALLPTLEIREGADGAVQQRIERRFDGQGHLAHVSFQGELQSEETVTWSGDTAVREETTSHARTTLRHDDRDRVVERRVDEDGDGTVDDIRRWHFEGERLASEEHEVAGDPAISSVTTYTYDARGRLTAMRNENGAGHVDSTEYGYDDRGRLAWKRSGDDRWTYAYEDGRIVSETKVRGGEVASRLVTSYEGDTWTVQRFGGTSPEPLATTHFDASCLAGLAASAPTP